MRLRRFRPQAWAFALVLTTTAALQASAANEPAAPDRRAPAASVSDEPAAGVAAGRSAVRFEPPAETGLPEGEFGRVIKTGERIFLHTPQNAPRYVGNVLNCASCHLDAGRRPDSAPMWGAYVSYPAYRSKNKHVNTLAERIQGCFQFSMNGKAPALGDPVLIALESYFYWLAKGAPVGIKLEGSGYPKLARPAVAPDRKRGAQVFAQHCALCHGADGQGQYSAGTMVFPPLWGPQSFNWGAGMHQLGNAAGFIKANMPLGLGGSLSDQQAWDVAYFMNSHERPQDPRFDGSVERTRKKYHDTDDSLYGVVIDGHRLGSR